MTGDTSLVAGRVEDTSRECGDSRDFVALGDIYPANAATMTYRETAEGQAYERGSYALRPAGFHGLYQYHVRL